LRTDTVTWKSWREKLLLFDTFDRRNFAKEELEGTRLKRSFFAFVRPEGRVLDLGCGTGFNQRFLSNGQTYVGIDPLRLKGAKQYNFPFLLGMAEYLPFRDNSFDSAVCIATLDHVGDPGMVVSESLRILRPGGVLGIMNKGEIEGGRFARYAVYLRLGLRKLRYGNIAGLKRGLLEVITGAEDDFHMHHFDRDSLRALCASGFQHIDTQMVGNTLFLRAIKADPHR
jgi:ubiquinone/menaquinone biosynthesis C-methylase UbiE